MSSFSTITGLNASTISRPPSFATPNTAEAKPQASAPIVVTTNYQPEKKKSHWFLKTIAAIAVIGGGMVAARNYIPQLKKVATEAAPTTGNKDKALYYLAKGADEIQKFVVDAYQKVKGWFDHTTKKPPTTT